MMGLCLRDDLIQCQIKDTVQPEGGVLWCVDEGTYNLTKYEENEIDSTAEESYEEEQYSTQQTYNPYKASGILDSRGMTEDEFKNSCYNLGIYFDSIGINDSTDDTLRFWDMLDYPNDYKGRHFKYHYENGTYSKGILIDAKGTTQDGNTYYIVDDVNTQQIYFDVRDDVYSPMISRGDHIIPYMIFTDIQTLKGKDYLCFNLISIDKR